ncbi:deoxynucleoside kinase, partial [Bacillus cereus]|uniref:deoxynucleoside kinase n=1 Tax=Bacillus cereus TaxID=1396 RepID=UPI00211113DC|nr:deoxynucleoside kinase [Bacillus cereus]
TFKKSSCAPLEFFLHFSGIAACTKQIEYWKEMHGRYENWINNFNSCPVLRLNINEYDILKDGDSIEPIIKKIGHFLKQTRKLVK